MTISSSLVRRQVFIGTVLQTEVPEPPPSSYKDIADANDHLHKVLNALLKERTGQHLTRDEQKLIDECVASKRWQLEHTKKD